jgi:microcin C transport system substrate-binding protein
LGALAASLALAIAAGTAIADAPKRQHALSLIGAPRFPAGFKQFDWVNPTAPKGGTVRLGGRGTFDSLYPFNIKGNRAAGLGLMYDTLMVTSPDEPSTEYCLLCEWVSHPDDFSAVTFGLRSGARFHDGKPVTVDDVVFSWATLRKDSPFHAQYYKNVVKADRTGEREVTFTFDSKGNRELPQIMGQLAVIPKHYWEGKDANGGPRDTSKSTLEPPLGSGPYRIRAFEPGRFIEYERVKDWWAKDLPVALGQWNFDAVRFEYFRDQTAAFEEFKAGRIDFWRESSAKQWATAFDLPQIAQGLIRKEQITEREAAQMQAFVLNLRRKQFQDPRVRRAFNLAFNFEDANKKLFYEQYTRVTNFFGEPDLMAKGLPEGKELEILETVRKDVPPEVFTAEPRQPVSASTEEFRKNLAEASRLLAAAGWTAKGGVLVNAAGEPLKAEFLLADPAFERIVQPYVGDLKRLGIQASIRNVDPPQYERRKDEFDFDIITDTFAQSASPGNEQRDYFSSAAADIKGSRNTIGIKSPAVDKLVDRIIFAKDREELAAATRALDRVLLAGHYVVPQWYAAFDRIAYWNMFQRPEKLPSRATAFQQVWWWDEAAAKALEGKRGK